VYLTPRKRVPTSELILKLPADRGQGTPGNVFGTTSYLAIQRTYNRDTCLRSYSKYVIKRYAMWFAMKIRQANMRVRR